MYNCLIGLFLTALQVTCDIAPESANVSQEEELVRKRAVYTDDQLDKMSTCAIYEYHHYMQTNRYATCDNCEAPPPPPPKEHKVDKEACLAAHNAKRALHQNTNPLTWSETLAQNAKDWADRMVETKTLEHDPDNKGVEGENLFWSSSLTDVGSCTEAVDAWYGQITNYNYHNPGYEFNDVVGHSTQVVWRGTTHVGVALTKIVNSDGYIQTYIVARYSPPGNSDHYSENVAPFI